MTVVEPSASPAAPVRRAVWDTIWLVAQLPGMTESYERLLEYGRLVNLGVPTRCAAVLLLDLIEEEAAGVGSQRPKLDKGVP